jgi:hypothetical protein
MTNRAPQPVETQMRRVRRRLFAQTLLRTLLWAAGGGLAALGLWFVLQPLAWPEPGAAVHWTVTGVLLGLALLFAVTWAVWFRPSSVEAALALDERFALRERVTTWLLLDAETASSPAGQALHADVAKRVGGLRVADQFPVRTDLRHLLAPAFGAVLCLVCFFAGPALGDLLSRIGPGTGTVQTPELREALENVKKVVLKPRDEPALSKEQKELDDALAKLLDKPLPENQEQVRERVQELRRLEEKIQERLSTLQEQVHRGDRLKKQLEKLAQGADAKKSDDPKKGEANDLEDALAKGNVEKAMEALEKLSKKLKDKGVSQKELAQLAQQLHELQQRLQRLMDMRDLQENLQRELEQGNLTPEQMKEMLEREMGNLQDLKDLTEMLKELNDRLAKDPQGAMKALERLKGKLMKLKLSEDELDDLENQGELLGQAREAMLLALQRLNQPGPIPGKEASDSPGFGKRPFGKEQSSKVRAERQRAKIDPAGEQNVTWSGSAEFKKVPAGEVGGVVRQSAQNAYQALDRQRIPPDAAEMTRRYFEKLAAPK